MLLYECATFLRPLANNDALRVFQHGAEQGADARRSRADDEHRVVLGNLADAGRPETGGQHIAHKQGLLVGNAIGNAVQSLGGQRHANILRLTTVNATTQRPTAMGRSAVVHISMLAIEALATEGLHIHGDAIAFLDAFHLTPNSLYNANHLMANGNAGHRPGHTTMLDVEIARTDTAQGNANNGVGGFLYHGFRLVGHGKPSFLYVCVCFHELCFNIHHVAPKHGRVSRPYGSCHACNRYFALLALGNVLIINS